MATKVLPLEVLSQKPLLGERALINRNGQKRGRERKKNDLAALNNNKKSFNNTIQNTVKQLLFD